MVKVIKKSVVFVVVVVLAYKFGPSIYTNIDRWLNTSFCDEPVTYTIGDIDKRFGITESQLQGFITLAAEDLGKRLRERVV